uniref:Uncharacterized protein n=1 Tax=Nelumbo nucifera TaxID=4432 RepID=A0A822Z9I3_NELNU|nr:TPA_asm: hypothetical protein HUJ06_014362 [Nelumbo nucifera]
MAEWSKAPDSSSGLREKAWVQNPLLTIYFCGSRCEEQIRFPILKVMFGLKEKARKGRENYPACNIWTFTAIIFYAIFIGVWMECRM